MKTFFTIVILFLSLNIFGQICFEIGSSESTVRNIQGTPTSINDYDYFVVWNYGSSSVKFENGRVKSYDNLSNNLRICKSTSNYTSSSDCFEIGSSESTVRNIQGTPTSINDYDYFVVWNYGSSSVKFENGKVKSYDNLSNNLRICKSTSNYTSSSSCFEIGSSESEVRNIQGTPTSINDYDYFVVWNYGSSSVKFESQRVKSYNNLSRNLKICDSNNISNNSSQNNYRNQKETTYTDNYDVGFNPFIGQTNSNVNFRTGPSQSNSVIKNLSSGTQVYVYSNKSINGFYKAIDIMTSDIGWIHKDYVSYIQNVDINESGAFQSTGYISSYNSEVIIRNKSTYIIKLVVENETFSLNPNSTKKVNIKPGNKYYIATAPGVTPASGHQEFESNNGYEWEFWVETRRY
ncbi:MAG: SH3 domain-containing protein [Prolixibacteraceae bacterium]|nr:SH3 domain-containing protein [Prolixibacteraceae bacterium]